MMKPVRAALNSWEEMVAEKKRIAAAMARMSPEGRAKTAAMNAAYARRMARRVARVGDDDSGDAATKFDSNAESPVAHLLLTPPLSSRALADALGPALAANLSLAEFETAWHAAWHKLLAVYAYLRYEMSDGETLLLLDSDAFIAEPDVDARDFLADVRARRVRYGDGQHAPLIGSFITSVVGATLPAFDTATCLEQHRVIEFLADEPRQRAIEDLETCHVLVREGLG